MIDAHTTSGNFCRFLDHGLVYNNNSVDFTVAPCCYFSDTDSLRPDGHDITAQITSARKKWQSADWTRTCEICLSQEKSGQPSYRLASFDMVPSEAKDLVVLTVAVNKQCNLACAICGPESSSFWFQQNMRDSVQQPHRIVNLHKDDRTGDIKTKFLSVFKDNQFQNIRYIKFGGGEPLMSSMHEKILECISEPSLVTVQYTSNFSIEPTAKVFKIWSRFRLVKWCASIDGIGSQFEMLRWPHRWQDLENMIPRVFAKAPHNVMFGVEHTLNPLNVWYFDRFQQWFQERFSANRFGDASDLNLHRCLGDLDLAQTPPALRQHLEDRLGSDSAVVRFLMQYPYSGSYQNLIGWMDNLDQRRATNWRAIFPEISAYF